MIADWFFLFIERHIMRVSAAGRNSAWPEVKGGVPSTEATTFFGPWIQKFVTHGVTPEAAEEASMRMAEGEHVPYPGPKHLDALMDRIAKAWEVVRARERGINTGTREEAAYLSKGCPECNGDGYAARDTLREGRVYSTALFCLCPHGEWLASYFFHNQKDTYNRIRRLIQYPELWQEGLSHRSWPEGPEPRPWPLENWWVRPEALDVEGYLRTLKDFDLKGIGRYG
jgi:hypothetical protein